MYYRCMFMDKGEIELLSKATVENVMQCIAAENYSRALRQLTLLSHRNLNLLDDCIGKILEDRTLADKEFGLYTNLFKSERLLNEQKTEEAADLIGYIIEKSALPESRQVLILAQLQKAVLNLYLNKQDESVQLFAQIEMQITDEDSPELKIQVLVYGYHFYSESDTQKAGEYIYRALELSTQIKDTYWRGYCLMHLGTLNTILSNTDLALEFFNESFSLFNQLQLNISMADNRMCQFNIFYRKKDFDNAINCLNDAIALAENSGWEHKIAICYGNLSTVYIQLAKFAEAKSAAEKDIEISRRLNNEYNVGIATFRLGRIEAALGNTQAAIALLLDSIEMRRNKISNMQLVQVYHYLHGLYAQSGDFKNAYEAQSAFMKLKLDILDAEKTKENEAQRAKYEAEKREAELREARLQQTESELKALKAQMNPHFIFNSLNSIQEIFFLGDKQLANEHLSRFSQLMRNILKASGRRLITLHEEIQMLEEYLALEALRFGADFSFEIILDNSVDKYTLDVPPMIIQPFVENAVKHGLQHKDGEKRLNIEFSFDEANAVITAIVADNGIGRYASALINSKRIAHQSFATSAIQRRFEVLNSSAVQAFSYHYIDAQNDKGIATGTQVLITIPVED